MSEAPRSRLKKAGAPGWGSSTPYAARETPDEARIRSARQGVEAAWRELTLRSGLMHCAAEAWRKSRVASRPGGDPHLLGLLEIEQHLFQRLARDVCKPAVERYKRTLRDAARGAGGSGAEFILKRLQQEDSADPFGRTEGPLATIASWRELVESCCTRALDVWKGERTPRAFATLVEALGLAESVHATDTPAAKSLQKAIDEFWTCPWWSADPAHSSVDTGMLTGSSDPLDGGTP